MRLVRLSLRNYRGIADAIIEPAARGITVISAANEVGKSSFCEALDVLLKFKSSSRSREVAALQPVGQDVGPEIAVEFAANELTINYRKRYLRQRETLLEIQGPAPEQLTGDDAHARAEALFAELIDKPLWDALRVTQAAGATSTALADQTILAKALDRAAGPGAVDDEGSHDLFERTRLELEKYYTKGRKLEARTLQRARQEQAAASADLAAIRERAAHLREDQHALERCEVERNELNAEVATLTAQHEIASRQVSELERLTVELAQRRQTREQARERLANRQALAQQQLETRRRHDEQTHQLERKQNTLDGFHDQRRELAVEIATARAAAAESTVSQTAAHAGLADAQAKLAVVAAQRDYQMLKKQADTLSEAERQFIDASTDLATLRVDQSQLERLRTLELSHRDADSRLANASVEMEIEAQQAVSLRADGDDIELAKGEIGRFRVDRDQTYQLDDIARLTIRPGGDVEQLRVRATESTAQLKHALDELGVESVGAALEMQHRRGALEERLGQLETQCAALRAHLPDNANSRLALLAQSAGDAQLPADLDAAFNAASQHAEGCAAQVATLAERKSKIERELASLTTSREMIAERIVVEQQETEWLKRELAQAAKELTNADTTDLAAAERALTTADADFVAAEAAVARLGPEAVDLRASSLAAGLTAVRVQLAEVDARAQSLRGGLQVREADGLYELEIDAQTRQGAVGQTLSTLERRARAAATLYDALSDAREQQRERYAQPLRAAMNKFGRIVFGSDFEILIDAELRITGRRLDGRSLPWESLSHGAQEQLGVLLRLAVATLVAEDEPPPLIFDDVLGHADSERLRSMNLAFGAAGDSLQILIFTCMPNRFQAFKAKRISLATQASQNT